MKILLAMAFITLITFNAQAKDTTDLSQCLSFMQHSEKKLHAKEQLDLCQLTAGKPILIVNTASHCGFTPQFTALEALHKAYKDKGLVVIGFPSNDFFQEEDEEKATADICFVNYGVTFTMLSPVHVWGSNAHPIFKELADKTTAPKWNFYKYLISADGKNIQHFNSKVTRDSDVFINAVNTIL
tara:strand:- start:1164 stop:1715 length:552 start_codon:yes stop_codon:yes gene_type:complete